MAKNSGPSFFWDKLVPTIYSAGAAVVILGALSKIQHWDGGSEMLTLGLGYRGCYFLTLCIANINTINDCRSGLDTRLS